MRGNLPVFRIAATICATSRLTRGEVTGSLSRISAISGTG